MSDLAKGMRVTRLAFVAVGVIGLSPAGLGAEELRLSADFGCVAGKIRPAQHSSGFGPAICSQTEQDLARVWASHF